MRVSDDLFSPPALRPGSRCPLAPAAKGRRLWTWQGFMELETDVLCNAGRRERNGERTNYRNQSIFFNPLRRTLMARKCHEPPPGLSVGMGSRRDLRAQPDPRGFTRLIACSILDRAYLDRRTGKTSRACIFPQYPQEPLQPTD